MRDLISKIVCGEAIVSNMECSVDFFFFFGVYLLAVLGLCCYAGFSVVAVHRLLITVAASLVAEHRLWDTWASVVAVPEL